ncbi:hypothetical protein IPS41_20125 [Xanthomonas perforans]|nr:hypothetical protein [Xanthomonas perforans]MBZ2741942.1 hypothetical protein [Xanthomonas perforans]MBZ2772388.1 hypothetical protein [Xanthomonas perforans]
MPERSTYAVSADRGSLRAHSDAEVKHLLEHGADGAVLAERELAYSLAEMVMSTPPYRALNVPAS